ncbi:hypothetical protein [Salipiger mucosus]|uniref:Uncharacterized protein n=1 Tax=Salipiger mucosus DSM 16094 TaxID=1123237 RepID=S9QWI7_9RHOB|nr:hypothetical protein [Salipiger mucosus]EPX83978.1 hypothetical protein Salmuc_01753 [Salipiger mucosus DSM 16094]
MKKLREVDRLAIEILRREVAKEQIAVKKARTSFSELQTAITELRSRIEIHRKSGPGVIRHVPLLGGARERKHQAELEELSRRRRVKIKALKDLRRKDATRRSRMQTYKDTAAWMHDRVKFIGKHSILIDDDLSEIAERLFSEMVGIQESAGFKKGPEVVGVLEDNRLKIEAWHDGALTRLDAVPAPAVRRAPDVSASESAAQAAHLGRGKKHRIYLPVHPSHANELASHGFRIDDTVGKGSQIYFDPHKDMEIARKWQGSLPTAARMHKRRFSFLDIADAAWGQNVRNVFKEEYWSTMRQDLNLMNGHRCMVCGNRGGKLISEYFKGEEKKSDSVECHEVWEWRILDEDRRVGVQKLKEILVLCNDCHMMFHEDLAVDLANRNGKDGDEVRDFLRARMAQVTGMERPELEEQLRAERAERESLNEIDHWIMDLQYLSDHAYLSKTVPEYEDSARNTVPMTKIAGTEFYDPQGALYEAQDVDALYDSLMRDLDETLSVGMTS